MFSQNINTVFCFENDLSVIFGFLTPNLITVYTNFHKNIWNKTQNMNENALPRFPR